ncbi:hypothetical protein [Streptomyces aurantiogriseus]|uniref:Uncharacterized protein n=1 Tax=Streptomyces aurantiogriseus TaxID=66870 RepID=A0A918CLV9_9ACTN|nr:hypothetical protein [Streptomyces aurantiogriseus]GGR30591.1 hypothetical protein GCM10010251_53270 [Streptomyces aurantiogriseus]
MASAESSSARAAGKVLTIEELKSLALTGGDVPGLRDEPSVEPMFQGGTTAPPVSNAECQPLVDSIRPEGSSAAVEQVFNWKDAIWSGGSILASYEGDGAEQLFRRLRGALSNCTSYSGVSYGKKYLAEVKQVKAASGLGGETLAFRMFVEVQMEDGIENPKSYSEYVLVRTGRAVVIFHNMAGCERDATFPVQPIRTLVERLTQAQLS